MPGQMGSEGVTVKNLRVVAVDAENNELWVRGGVPGGKGSVVTIRKAGE
jgi:large subunit ribosomal protein L3